jgi:hypothetical protein
MTFPHETARKIITGLVADVAGASAVENGIMLGILGSVIFFAFRGPFLDLGRALGLFPG